MDLRKEVEQQIEYYEWLHSTQGILDAEYKETEELLDLFKRILDNLPND